MKRILSITLIVVLLAAGLTAFAAAGDSTIVTFDDLTGGGYGTWLPAAYAGLNWDPEWFYWDWYQPPFTPSSGATRIATHNYGGWVEFPQPVMFEGAWFSGREDVQIWIEGYLDDVLVGSVGPLTLSDIPTYLEANFPGVDKINVVSSSYNYFAMDDLTYMPMILVDLDIKPGSDPNSINLKSKGVVPVAIMTTDDFDATIVDPETVTLEGLVPVKWQLCDVPEIWDDYLMTYVGDGDLDLILYFATADLATIMDTSSTEATLVGETYAGVPIEGTDSVRIVK